MASAPGFNDQFDNQAAGHRAGEMFAFIAINEQGDEGLLGVMAPAGYLKFVASRKELIETMRPYAEEIARTTRQRVVLRRYVVAEDLEELPHG
jgi:hypothetical protein